MTSILFRTNAGKHTGLGHLVRCLHLARELEANGAHCAFVLDYVEESVLPFLSGMEYHTLHDAPQENIAEEKDAKKFLHVCASRKVDWVILDDYRLGKNWEDRVTAGGQNICVIDDLKRHHNCKMLIDIAWRGKNTQQTYDKLVPVDTIKLLGPSYAMLSASYRGQFHMRSEHDPFTVMIGLGGSGNLEICANIVDSLLTDKRHQETRIKVVLGPLSEGSSDFKNKYKSTANVQCLLGETELYPHLKDTDFYIGAAGGMMYQLRCLNIPALTFSIAENQHNDLIHLHDTGHFFHLNEWIADDLQKIPTLVHKVQENYDRAKAMGESPVAEIDGYGTTRICERLLKRDLDVPESPFYVEMVDETTLSPEHTLRATTDRDINHYVDSRNLDANCQNMIKTDKIAYIDHYTWWYRANRQSFLLKKNEKPSLYIWHESVTFDEGHFLIGGWFVCTNKADFQDALIALDWQLKHCDEHYPHHPWIAVIHRENKYVKLMNDRAGFIEIDQNHSHWKAIAHFFNEASPEDFHYVIREPKGEQS